MLRKTDVQIQMSLLFLKDADARTCTYIEPTYSEFLEKSEPHETVTKPVKPLQPYQICAALT